MSTWRKLPRTAAWGVALAIMLWACSDATVTAQSAQPTQAEAAAISDCSAQNTVMATSITSFVAAMTHSWHYDPLSLDAFNAVLSATRALNQGEVREAMGAASAVGFEVVGLRTDRQCFLMLRPTDSAPQGQASLIYLSDWQRDLVIEAPHVPEDHGTDAEAASLFEGLGAKALVIAGAHRCAVTVSSGCRATKQCNNAGIPVESDPAHSIDNAVNAMHLAFRDSETSVLQLHTNFRPDLNGDALVSNGTRYAIEGTPADAFFLALQSPDIDARWCNDPAAPANPSSFCGDTNVQGLASNGASDSCQGHASSAGGSEHHHFIHLEQNNDRIATDPTWNARVQAALQVAIPAR